jgi:16S rRNA (guanine527-N7)-methyltransferase
MESENRNLLIAGSKAFHLSFEEEQVEAFDLYLKELLKWNKRINLTAIRSEKGIIVKHFLDSLSAYPYLPESSALLDIGSGAGFPGIPLKIAAPSFRVTLIDSVQKKVDFQKHIIRTLGLKEIEAIHGRIQDQEVLLRYGESFDAVMSRAFSDLQTYLSLSRPFLKKGGIAVAMKGRRAGEENHLPSEPEATAYRMKGSHTFFLPFSQFKRSILVFEKQ